MAASTRSPAQRRASKKNIKKAQCAKIARARGYCKPKRAAKAASASRSSSKRTAEERSESARKAARTRKRNAKKLAGGHARASRSSGAGNRARSPRSKGTGSTRRQSEMAREARRLGIPVRELREILQVEGLRRHPRQPPALRSASHAGGTGHRTHAASAASSSSSSNRNPNGTFRTGHSRIAGVGAITRLENPRRRGAKKAPRRPRKKASRRMSNPRHDSLALHEGMAMRPMGATEMVLAVGVAAGSYVMADFLDRFLATRGVNGQPAAIGGQANALIQSKPNGMRLGVQAGVAVLGGLGSWYLASRHPTAASLAGGLAGGFGTHLLVQLINTHLMPAVLKASSLNDVTLGNRLYPEDQPAFQAVYAAQGGQAVAALPVSSTTTSTTTSALAQRRRYGVAGVGEAPAAAGVGCAGRKGCSCPGTTAGVGCACDRPKQDWQSALQNVGYGTGSSWNGDLSFDGQRHLWMTGVGTPATGPQIAAFLARRQAQAAAGVGCSSQGYGESSGGAPAFAGPGSGGQGFAGPGSGGQGFAGPWSGGQGFAGPWSGGQGFAGPWSGDPWAGGGAVPLMLDRQGRHGRRLDRSGMAPVASQDAAGNVMFTAGGSTYAAVISPLDCSSMDVTQLIPVVDANGMTFGYLDPQAASQSMQWQDQHNGSPVPPGGSPVPPGGTLPMLPAPPVSLIPSVRTTIATPPSQDPTSGLTLSLHVDPQTSQLVTAHADSSGQTVAVTPATDATGSPLQPLRDPSTGTAALPTRNPTTGLTDTVHVAPGTGQIVTASSDGSGRVVKVATTAPGSTAIAQASAPTGTIAIPMNPSAPAVDPKTNTPTVPLRDAAGMAVPPKLDAASGLTVTTSINPLNNDVVTKHSDPATGATVAVTNQGSITGAGAAAAAQAQDPNAPAVSTVLSGPSAKRRAPGSARLTPRQRRNMMAGLPFDDESAPN